MKHFRTKYFYSKGVTLFFAILLIGLMLGIGASISLLAQKQLKFSTLGTQSERGFYAANAAAECAEYWDKKVSPNPFSPTSTDPAVIQCDGKSITIDPGNSRTFSVYFGPTLATQTCASTTVTKLQFSGVWITQIESHGYNICTPNATNRLERAIFISY